MLEIEPSIQQIDETQNSELIEECYQRQSYMSSFHDLPV